MGILFVSIVFSTVIFLLLYANIPFMQSEEFKEDSDDEVEMWERW